MVSLISSTSVRGSPTEAAPRFVRLRKDTQHSYPSTRLRCTMTGTSLNEGASGIAHKDGVVIVDHGSRRQESNLLLSNFFLDHPFIFFCKWFLKYFIKKKDLLNSLVSTV